MGAKTRTGQHGDGLYFGQCASCATENRPEGYVTSHWPTEKLAKERVAQHANEHETGELMEDLQDFLKRNGLVAKGRGEVEFVDPFQEGDE